MFLKLHFFKKSIINISINNTISISSINMMHAVSLQCRFFPVCVGTKAYK